MYGGSTCGYAEWRYGGICEPGPARSSSDFLLLTSCFLLLASGFFAGLVGEVGEDGAELLVGGYEAGAAFGDELGGTACEGGEAVDVAFVALHKAQNAFKFGYGLIVGEFFDGCHGCDVDGCGLVVSVDVTVEVIVPCASVVSITEPGAMPAGELTARPLTRVME